MACHTCVEEYNHSDEWSPWSHPLCVIASIRGHVECLRHAHEAGHGWSDSCRWASKYGHLDCLRYAHQNGCPWDESVCSYASETGQLECLRYAHEHDCPWDERTVARAMFWGHLGCLRYAIENGCPVPRSVTDIDLTVVPYCYHQGILSSDPESYRSRVRHWSTDPDLLWEVRNHIRIHVSRARTLLRCAVRLLGAYAGACARIYAPGAVGYREAESSFRAISKIELPTPGPPSRVLIPNIDVGDTGL